MNILIITQKVDKQDGVLGFFHRWIEEIAKNCERVTVICLFQGKSNLPENVKILSLGKEKGENRIKYFWRFLKYIVQEVKNYDTVFVHMNQIYVILGGLFWKLRHKKIGLWYAHGYVPFSLRIAEKIADTIFTSTPLGFRLKSKKIKIVGQGIDTNFFKPSTDLKINDSVLKIITVGRISPVKDYETMIKTCELLNKDNINFNLDIIGSVGNQKDLTYLNNLKKLVDDLSLNEKVSFLGEMGNEQILSYLQKADVFLNCSLTGSLDKAILEAMACGLMVFSCNDSFVAWISSHNKDWIFEQKDYVELEQKIKKFYQFSIMEKNKISIEATKLISDNFSLNNLIKKILNLY